MFHARIDANRFRFVIEDGDGNLVAERGMPSWQLPRLLSDELMQLPGNQEAWQAIQDLVAAANRGAAILNDGRGRHKLFKE